MSEASNHRVVLSLIDGTDFYRSLEAGFDAEGNLVVAGHDIGGVVEEIFGRDEYEYWITVSKEDVPHVAHALAEITGESPQDKDSLEPFVTAALKRIYSEADLPVHFNNSSDFRRWITAQGIETQFYSWP